MTVARQLAEFLTETAYDDLPEPAVDIAELLIASTLASAAAGRDIESAAIIRALAQERGGTPEASVWFDAGDKLPVVSAARANALMSDAAASDDSDLRNIVHHGTPLTASAFATAERTGATGQDILAAMVLGYEAAGRIGEAIKPVYHSQRFHGCIVAVFNATVASGRLLGLDAEQMTHAIALTATSIGGLHAAANTSLAREYHAGLATMLGIEAAMAAQRGYTAEENILESPHGYCAVFGESDGAGIVQDLGKDWDIVTDMAVKLVPGGHTQHGMAEAAANAAREGDIAPDEVAAIIVSKPGVTALSGPLHPADLIDMAHSPAYFAAAGVADRDFTWAHATPEKIADPVIHRLIDLVRVGPEPTENLAAYRQGATVTIETTDGRTVTNTVHVPKGTAARGVGWEEIDAKYRTLAPNALTEPQVEASLEVMHDFRRVANVADLLDLLR
ncbi:MAG: MmgE/PrpD family protein [Alphaproteobacteria bacterium]|nr:MmgE/PrpD family protein [Alphaproteobacteria bacterium]